MAKWAQAWAMAALCCVAAGLAFAHGPMVLPGFVGSTGGDGGGAGAFSTPWFGSPDSATPRVKLDTGERTYDDRYSGGKRRRSAHAGRYSGSGRYAGGNAVCVRLCDGFFFPAPAGEASAANCAVQCPDAPTALYSMPTDRIEDAAAVANGESYMKLPVAKRFQTTRESTCSCRRDAMAARDKTLVGDSTLRKGDIVMTTGGFRVYEGAGWGPSLPQDFVSVAKAGLSKDQRDQLSAMEHASAATVAPAAPTQVAQRPRGAVTVEDGPR